MCNVNFTVELNHHTQKRQTSKLMVKKMQEELTGIVPIRDAY